MSKFRLVTAGGSAAAGRVERTFLLWTFVRAIFHRGYVLASSLYYVLVAHLAASQLLLLGTAMGLVLLVGDVPVGALADTIGRRGLLALGHAFLAVSMILTGLVAHFSGLVAAQLLWGAGWALSMGVDVAWMTDELGDPERSEQVVAGAGRLALLGGALGVIAFGLLADATGLRTAVVASGLGMALVGLYVAICFTERRFAPVREPRLSAAFQVLRHAVRLASADREIQVVLAATALFNGAEMVAWLFARRLSDLGFPINPGVWYAGLGIAGFTIGSPTLRVVARHLTSSQGARWAYALACLVGTIGLIMIALAPDALVASVGILIITAVASNVTRVVSVIWVNRCTPAHARATVLSLLSQAETVGEIIAGLALALLAGQITVSGTLASAAGLLALTAALVAAFGSPGPTEPERPRRN